MGRGNTEKQLHTVPPPGSALRKGCIQRGSSSSYGTENLFPPSPPAGPNGRQHGPCRPALCSKGTFCCLSALLLLILLGIVALITLAEYPSNRHSTSLAVQGDMLLLNKADILWYRKWSVREVQLAGDYPYTIRLFNVPCSRLVRHQFQGHFESPVLQLLTSTRSLAHTDYVYLLEKSTLVYDICLWANESTPSAELFAFDSETDYKAFIDEESSGSNSVAHYKLDIGALGLPICTQVRFTASKSSYYFLSAKCNSGVMYQYNITSYVNYLNQTDYRDYPKCALRGSESCSLVLDNRFFPPSENHCLLAHVDKLPPYLVVPPTTHVKVTTERRYSILVVPISVLVIGIIALLGHLVILWSCRYRWAQAGYERIA